MKESVRIRWTTRLRSGQDVQGENYLRDENDKFCCLGVLCEIAVEDGVIEPPTLLGRYGYAYAGDTQFLAKVVQEWAGLDSADGKLPGSTKSLAYLNDIGKPFAEIADIIDEEF